ncbi:unnamed protein product [Linum trigynum]|uniref:Reverse transcriptase Ty1/copia-type domain-containing protein n=1 Tax=Linum trigynum TaxID=586398 RepID=A0AAV2CLU7_9ROSI
MSCSLQSMLDMPLKLHQDYVTYRVYPILIPTGYSQAKGNPNWECAMTEEIDVHHTNQNLLVVPSPSLVVDSRWVFIIKFKHDGSLDRYKAFVVAQGFSQEYGVDFEETFAHVAEMVFVSSLLVVALLR